MKTKITFYTLILIIGILLFQEKAGAQVYTLGPVGTPPHDMIQSNTGKITFMQGTGTYASTAALSLFGVNTQTPLELFDVSGGNIDVFTSTKGYKIDTQMVLWHNGHATNIFVGVGAGNDSTGLHNVYIGYNAAHASSSQSQQCVIIGDHAGDSNTSAGATFVGCQAGQIQKGADFNTFIGFQSGLKFYSNGGGDNAYLGAYSGWSDSIGSGNTLLGTGAGKFLKTGSGNTFIGSSSGLSNTGGNNDIAIGGGSDVTGNNSNEIAIGVLAVATAANTLTLGGATTGAGAFATWVGIGLSGDAPHWPLEINALTQTNTVLTDSSGLKFRQLTSS